jgi:hypothetical protein
MEGGLIMTWTPDYKKDMDRIKKAKLEKLNPTPQGGQYMTSQNKPFKGQDDFHEETDVGDVKPTQRIKDMIKTLHGVSQPRGIYGDLFLELAEEIIIGITAPGDQRDIGNNILSKLKKRGFRVTTGE